MSGKIPPAAALAHLDPGFFESLSEAERLVLPYMYDLWLRPEQRILRSDWRSLGFICGRGFGKSLSIGCEMNRRVECGEARAIGLIAPTEDRVDEVQIAFLIDTAPPWFKPERYRGGLLWPNGVQAEVHTPEVPGSTRSSNFDLVWMTEIVAWPSNMGADGRTVRREAFDNITTAARIGGAQYIWDTTSKGRNDIIDHLQKQNAKNPDRHVIIRGSTFDNPQLSKKYLEDECAKYSGRQFDEEILGKVFQENAGASWKEQWLSAHRTPDERGPFDIVLVALDPALSVHKDSDETGIMTGGSRGAHAYLLRDQSGRHKPEEWGDIAVQECVDGAAGVVIETNHLGLTATSVLRSRATNRKIDVRVLPRDGKPFPRRTAGVMYVREVTAASSKSSRADAPASESEAGRAHLVGTFPDLELQLTTYEQGVGKSPNRFDAFVYLITELRGLAQDGPKTTGEREVQAALTAHRELQRQLLAMKQRRVGL